MLLAAALLLRLIHLRVLLLPTTHLVVLRLRLIHLTVLPLLSLHLIIPLQHTQQPNLLQQPSPHHTALQPLILLLGLLQRHIVLVNLQQPRIIRPDQRLRHLIRHGQQVGRQVFMHDNDLLDRENAASIASHEEQMQFVKDKGYTDVGTAWSPKHQPLVEVEDYLKKTFKHIGPKQGVELAYDVTAVEPLYFPTLNYTTYAGSLMLHPVSYEQAIRQMADAYADNIQLEYDHVDYIKERIKKDGTFSKYVYTQKEEVQPRKVLVVLPGGNKLKKHCCVGKIERILSHHGRDNVLFKKHPISYLEIYDELSDYLGGINYAPNNSDLYDLIKGSEYVFTTMLSESTLISSILEKKIGHFDLWQNRDTASFGHIGYYLFSTKDPVAWARRAFASPKSGIINPSVDIDWRSKIDVYLDYIMELRSTYAGAYLQ